MLSSTLISATNLLVKEYGVNNTYPTIQAAIDAASHGDSIIVYDKPSGMNWQENIIIDKVLHIVNADGLRQNLDGDIKVVPASGDTYTFIGIDLMDGHKFYTEYSIDSLIERCTINIIDCSAPIIDMDDNGLFVRLISNSLGDVAFSHGLMIDNDGTNMKKYQKDNHNVVYYHGYFEIENDPDNHNDSIILIGNINFAGKINSNAKLIIRNNFFQYFRFVSDDYLNHCSHRSQSHDPIILDLYNVSDQDINISNNTFAIKHRELWHDNYCGGDDYHESHRDRALRVRLEDNLHVYNNVFDHVGHNGWSNDIRTIFSENGSGIPFISHNYIDNDLPSISVNTNNEFNSYNTSISTDEYGKCIGDCIDGGIYLGQYNDIDGTRNDAGTFGGSHSIDNYLQDSDGKARVYYIDMTNFINSPNNISIKGGGATIH